MLRIRDLHVHYGGIHAIMHLLSSQGKVVTRSGPTARKSTTFGLSPGLSKKQRFH